MKIATFDVGGTFIKYALMHNDIMSLQGKVSTPRDNQEHFLQTIEDVLKQMGTVDGIALLYLVSLMLIRNIFLRVEALHTIITLI